MSLPAGHWFRLLFAHACTPSLPICMSQNKALSRQMALVSLRTKIDKLEGCGAVRVLSEGISDDRLNDESSAPSNDESPGLVNACA